MYTCRVDGVKVWWYRWVVVSLEGGSKQTLAEEMGRKETGKNRKEKKEKIKESERLKARNEVDGQ